MTDTIQIFFSGFGLSAGLIIAIGAQNAHVLRQGIRRQYVALVVFICAFWDWSMIAVGALGFGRLINENPQLTRVAALGGALFLFVYGVLAFRSALKPSALLANGDSPPLQDRRAVILTTLGVSMLNPHVYLDTVVLLGGLAAQYDADGRVVFAAGAAVASSVWFGSLGFGARVLAPIFEDARAWQALDVIIGIIMWAIALTLLLGELVPAN